MKGKHIFKYACPLSSCWLPSMAFLKKFQLPRALSEVLPFTSSSFWSHIVAAEALFKCKQGTKWFIKYVGNAISYLSGVLQGQEDKRRAEKIKKSYKAQLTALKGYGLHTILMHQFRGLVVCFKQKKTTGAKSGYGTSGSGGGSMSSSSSSSPRSGDGGGCSKGVSCSVTPRSTRSRGHRVGLWADGFPECQAEEGWEPCSAMLAWIENPWRGGEKTLLENSPPPSTQYDYFWFGNTGTTDLLTNVLLIPGHNEHFS